MRWDHRYVLGFLSDMLQGITYRDRWAVALAVAAAAEGMTTRDRSRR